MPKATEPNTTTEPAEPIDDDTMEEWEIGDVEPVLHKLKAEIAILGHLLTTPDKVDQDTFAQLEDSLTESHAALVDRWHGSWRFERQERVAAAKALEAAKAERAPGSIDDIKNAEVAWGLLHSAATVVLDECRRAGLIRMAPAPDSDDAELIELCNRLIEINGEEEALYARIKDEDQREEATDPLYEEIENIRLRLFAIRRPVTRAGAEAAARAGWVHGDRAPNGTPLASRLSDWLRLAACAYLADAVGPEIWGDAEPNAEATDPKREAEGPVTVGDIYALVQRQAAEITAVAERSEGARSASTVTIIADALSVALGLKDPGPSVAFAIVKEGFPTVAPKCPLPEYISNAIDARKAIETDPAPEVASSAEPFDPYLNRPDAALVHMAREFAKIDARIQVLNELPDGPDEAMNAVTARQFALTDIMIETPATSRAGWRAKAEVLDASIRLNVTSPEAEHLLAVSLAADLMEGIAP